MAKKIHRRRDADPKKGVEKYGDTAFADWVNKKYPIDTPGRIKAAWAYIHQPENAGKYTPDEVRTIKIHSAGGPGSGCDSSGSGRVRGVDAPRSEKETLGVGTCPPSWSLRMTT